MINILSNSNETTFNLATEEYFLKETQNEYFILYINKPSVVIGRNQNPYEEVNIPFLLDNDIQLVRRITGGGAVYHDLGNINYSFIVNGLEHLNDYEYFTKKITEPLNKIGVPVTFREKSHIFLDNHKVSGNAQTFFKNRVLHHGTLLFSTDIESLKGCLKPKVYVESKSIKSNRSQVKNIDEYVGYNTLLHTLLPNYRTFSDEEIQDIRKFEDKYFKWEWNYGESPRFTYSKSFSGYDLIISVRNGLIQEAVLKKNLEKYPLSSIINEPFKMDTFESNRGIKEIDIILENIKTLY